MKRDGWHGLIGRQMSVFEGINVDEEEKNLIEEL